jgi:hypothetical protein
MRLILSPCLLFYKVYVIMNDIYFAEHGTSRYDRACSEPDSCDHFCYGSASAGLYRLTNNAQIAFGISLVWLSIEACMERVPAQYCGGCADGGFSNCSGKWEDDFN